MSPRVDGVQDLGDEVDEVAVDAQPARGEFAVDDHSEGWATVLPGFGECERNGVRRPLVADPSQRIGVQRAQALDPADQLVIEFHQRDPFVWRRATRDQKVLDPRSNGLPVDVAAPLENVATENANGALNVGVGRFGHGFAPRP